VAGGLQRQEVVCYWEPKNLTRPLSPGILVLMISTINRIHVQGTSCHAIAFGEGGTPHKPIGLELRAERFTPVPGVHNRVHPIAQTAGSG
jgi:hypothetical protein